MTNLPVRWGGGIGDFKKWGGGGGGGGGWHSLV